MYNLTCSECLAGLVEKAILSRQTGSLGEAGISDINCEEEFMWGGQGVRMSPGTGTTCPSVREKERHHFETRTKAEAADWWYFEVRAGNMASARILSCQRSHKGFKEGGGAIQL